MRFPLALLHLFISSSFFAKNARITHQQQPRPRCEAEMLVKEFNSWSFSGRIFLLLLPFFVISRRRRFVVAAMKEKEKNFKRKTGKINYQGTEEDKKLNYINIFEKCALCCFDEGTSGALKYFITHFRSAFEPSWLCITRECRGSHESEDEKELCGYSEDTWSDHLISWDWNFSFDLETRKSHEDTDEAHKVQIQTRTVHCVFI